MTKQNDTVLSPELSDAFLRLKQDVFRSMNCVKIGTIQKFDLVKKKAEIQILFKRVLPDGKIQSYPLLVDCPVVTPQGGGASLRFPISAGDQCLVLFSDRNIDAWFKTGAESPPPDSRCHDLSDGIALLGVNALTSSLDAYVANKVVLSYGGFKLEIQGNKVAIKNASKSLLTLLEGLIDAIKAVTADTTTGPAPLSTASQLALNNQKLLFEELLNP